MNKCECHALNSLKDCLNMHVGVIFVVQMVVMDLYHLCKTFRHITLPFIRPLEKKKHDFHIRMVYAVLSAI